MPKQRYQRQEPTHDWQQICPLLKDPAQITYEILRPIVLYGDPAVQRAKERGEARNTLERKADAFDDDEQGMVLSEH